jgi:hypothetical protein
MDFSKLHFLPDLNTVCQLEEILVEEYIQMPKIQRAKAIVGSNFEP